MLKLKSWIFGVGALLSAGAAQGAVTNEPYATVGDWDITADNQQQCSMSQIFGSKVAEEIQLLGVTYHSQKGLALSWVSNKPRYLPSDGSIGLHLAFLKGSSSNETWGKRAFSYRKVDRAYYFNHVFAGPTDIDRILRDLSASEIISLNLGPTLMMALPLNAADAIKKLRECTTAGERAR